MVIAGVDIGNSTTEICIGRIDGNGNLAFLSSSEVATTGTKGTVKNIKGIKEALNIALDNAGIKQSDLSLVRLNEAAPVIGDTAMETITETIITDSTMVGHNPDTPAGQGVAVGITISIERLDDVDYGKPLLVMVPDTFNYEEAARILNSTSCNIAGVISQKDEAVLIYNRMNRKVPIVDEVARLEDLPEGKIAAIEVALPGMAIRTLSNPYGLAKLFNLNADDTAMVIPIAKSLIGKKSAVVVKSVQGGVKETKIRAGRLSISKAGAGIQQVDIDKGAEAIMAVAECQGAIEDVSGERGTYIGDMLQRMKQQLSSLSEESESELTIRDIMAIDTFVPIEVKGALAGETAMEKAVAIAAMVKADKLPMNKLAKLLQQELNVDVKVAGVEAVMAVIGAMTTKGTKLPLAILDLGGGSTDAAILDENGVVKSIHLAGAGAFVTMLLDKELCLEDRDMAEAIKRHPLAKVNSLYHMTMENGEVVFFKEPLEPKLYARVVVVSADGLIPVMSDLSLERMVMTRREVKDKVFVDNAIRALKMVASGKDIRSIPNVVMVGGSALDSEIPELIQEELANSNIVAGRADIRSRMGPRNAVATGLVMSYLSEAFR